MSARKANQKKDGGQRREEQRGSGIGNFIRRQRELANISLRNLAEQSGVSPNILREIEAGLRHPSQAILQSIAAALRLSAATLNLQAGILAPQDFQEIPVIREILRDPHLTDQQREILKEIYRTFRLVNAQAPRDDLL